MQLINEDQAAEYLGCSVSKLQKDRRIGSKIPYIKVGRSVRYTMKAIEQYIEERTFTSTSQYENNAVNLRKRYGL